MSCCAARIFKEANSKGLSEIGIHCADPFASNVGPRKTCSCIIDETIIISHLNDYPALGDQPGRLAFNWRTSQMQAFQ